MLQKLMLLYSCVTLVVVGCGSESARLSEMTLAIAARDFEPEGFQGLSITVNTTIGSRTLSANDFSVVPSIPIPRTEPFEVPNQGNAFINLRFSVGGFKFPAQRGLAVEEAFAEHLGGGAEVERFSRPSVHQVLDALDLGG